MMRSDKKGLDPVGLWEISPHLRYKKKRLKTYASLITEDRELNS